MCIYIYSIFIYIYIYAWIIPYINLQKQKRKRKSALIIFNMKCNTFRMRRRFERNFQLPDVLSRMQVSMQIYMTDMCVCTAWQRSISEQSCSASWGSGVIKTADSVADRIASRSSKYSIIVNIYSVIKICMYVCITSSVKIFWSEYLFLFLCFLIFE